MIFVVSECPRYSNQVEEATDEELQNIYPTNESYSSLIGNIRSLPPLSLSQKGEWIPLVGQEEGRIKIGPRRPH